MHRYAMFHSFFSCLCLLFSRNWKRIIIILSVLFIPLLSYGANQRTIPGFFGIRFEFILFGLTLIGIATFHRKTSYIAVAGLLSVILFKYIFDPSFSFINHLVGTTSISGQWKTLLNLTGLLLGFAILARHFAESRIPDILPGYLPHDWRGGLFLLFFIMFISSFLDNIAAAMIGGTIAMCIYNGKVHLGFLAAIIAASNAGGAGSIIGDTTTTMMWIDGIHPLEVLHAYTGSIVCFAFFGVVASIQQHRYQPLKRPALSQVKVDWKKIGIVILILVSAILSSWIIDFPSVGVWVAILIGAIFTTTPWRVLKSAWQGTIFLVSLVALASLIPVDSLPKPSIVSTFGLGFISSVFDNIPLTKLCLVQGHYDWGLLAYAIGFGGSIIWFGSSAGVAISNLYPETKETINYIKKGWHVIIAYMLGFFVILGLTGWHPASYNNKSHRSEVSWINLRNYNIQP